MEWVQIKCPFGKNTERKREVKKKKEKEKSATNQCKILYKQCLHSSPFSWQPENFQYRTQ